MITGTNSKGTRTLCTNMPLTTLEAVQSSYMAATTLTSVGGDAMLGLALHVITAKAQKSMIDHHERNKQ